MGLFHCQAVESQLSADKEYLGVGQGGEFVLQEEGLGLGAAESAGCCCWMPDWGWVRQALP